MSVSVVRKLNGDADQGLSETIKAFGTNIPAATDRDGIGIAQVRTGAGNLTITGAGAAAGVYNSGFTGGRLLTLYSTGNLSALTFTVTGTDWRGDALSESITGPNNTTVTGTKYFQTVTQVAVGATIGTNVEVGFAASTVVLDTRVASHFQLSPTNGEAVCVALYGEAGSGTGLKDNCSLKVTTPATGTYTWADGTTPSDTRVYFAGGTEPTLTASGTDYFKFEADGATASSDAIWYCTAVVQDLKP